MNVSMNTNMNTNMNNSNNVFASTNPTINSNMAQNKPKMGLFDNMVAPQKTISQSTNMFANAGQSDTSNKVVPINNSGSSNLTSGLVFRRLFFVKSAEIDGTEFVNSKEKKIPKKY